jgi:hypothetical protein
VFALRIVPRYKTMIKIGVIILWAFILAACTILPTPKDKTGGGAHYAYNPVPYHYTYGHVRQDGQKDMYVLGPSPAHSPLKEKPRLPPIPVRLLEPPPPPEKVSPSPVPKLSSGKITIMFHVNEHAGPCVTRQLDKALGLLKGAPSVNVRGFTCSMGPKRVNDKLAMERAKSVARYLKEHGIIVKEITGVGKDRYLSKTPALNRHVEISLGG